MEFLPPEIQQYAEEHTTAESAILQKITRDTFAKVLMPRMLSGNLQGQLLSVFSRMLKPKSILEVGTYTGYSAICLAQGLAPGGKLITIDINEELEERVSGYFQEAGLADKIEYRIGNALDIIPQLTASFDLVFLDADKENYLAYYHLLIEKIHPGGFIIADNVLWSGKVTDPTKKDKDTAAVRAFNDFVQADNRVENILLPVRDGLMIARKL